MVSLRRWHPLGRQLESWLLRFCSLFLPMCLRKRQEVAQVRGPAPLWESWVKLLASSLAQPHLFCPFGGGVDQQMEDLPLPL